MEDGEEMSSGGANVLLPVTGGGLTVASMIFGGYPLSAVIIALIVAISCVSILVFTKKSKKH